MLDLPEINFFFHCFHLGHLCVPAGVVRRFAGGSGQLQSPPPGRCGHAYATHVQGLHCVRLRLGLYPTSDRGGIGPVWCRPACTTHNCKGLPHIAQARQGWPSLRVVVHFLTFRAFSLYTSAAPHATLYADVPSPILGLSWHAVSKPVLPYKPKCDELGDALGRIIRVFLLTPCNARMACKLALLFREEGHFDVQVPPLYVA